MTSTDTAVLPPDSLIASSDADWLLSGAMDNEEAKLPSPPESYQQTLATEVIPPLQPESEVVKNNKAVPW